jgi:hypothetical protein
LRGDVGNSPKGPLHASVAASFFYKDKNEALIAHCFLFGLAGRY